MRRAEESGDMSPQSRMPNLLSAGWKAHATLVGVTQLCATGFKALNMMA
jgi:hypothetical protein